MSCVAINTRLRSRKIIEIRSVFLRTEIPMSRDRSREGQHKNECLRCSVGRGGIKTLYRNRCLAAKKYKRRLDVKTLFEEKVKLLKSVDSWWKLLATVITAVRRE